LRMRRHSLNVDIRQRKHVIPTEARDLTIEARVTLGQYSVINWPMRDPSLRSG
jgi:hypothetical protein